MVWDQCRHPCILLVHHMLVEGAEGELDLLDLLDLLDQAEHQA